MSAIENLAFGPFTLTGNPPVLRCGEQVLALAPRALEMLAAIAVAPAGAPATQLWPLLSSDPVMDEDDLCKLVGDVNTVLGQWSPAWYVAWFPEEEVPRFALLDATRRASALSALPARRTDIFGRDQAIAQVVERLRDRRFVTILGAGGMGKTTVALAAAHAAASDYPDGVHLVDLAPIAIVDFELVARRVATAVGCGSVGADPFATLQRWAGERRVLVILDSCEHVIEAASRVAETLVGTGRTTAVLATSREPLRAAGEWLHRLAPMQLPQQDETVTAEQAMAFSALRLFVERASAADSGFALADADVARLVSLCTRLDGIPLAIEIVAARVHVLGLAGLASQLERLLLELPVRHRSAPARHATLAALLDWSYRLLSPAEQQVLQRLSVFRDGFTLDAVVEVVVDDTIDAGMAQEIVLDLMAKSLVAPSRGGDVERRRLLDTTRAYAGAKLDQSGERDAVQRRHASWVAAALAEAERRWNGMARPQWVAQHAPLIDDVRAALDWAFTPRGDLALGIDLTITGLSLGIQMLLIEEFIVRLRQAIEALVAHNETCDDGAADLATSALHTQLHRLVSNFIAVGFPCTDVVSRTLEISVASLADTGEFMPRFSAFKGMWSRCIGRGDFRDGATWTARLAELAATSDDPVAHLVAGRIQAQNLQFLGRHREASEHARRVLADAWRTIPLVYNPSPVELRVSMRVVLARALWMQGFPDRATEMAAEAMAHASTDSPMAQCQVISMAAIVLALWSGHDQAAQALSSRLVQIEPVVGSDHWLRWSRRLRDAVALRIGGHVATHQSEDFFDEAEPVLADHLATLDDRWLSPACIHRVASGMVGWCAPEALRRQGERALRERSAESRARGEAFLQRSLSLAREQDALSWELRAATSLARHWQAQERTPEARALLEPVFARFTEGLATSDLRDARRLIETL
jgi:predicted ATPase